MSREATHNPTSREHTPRRERARKLGRRVVKPIRAAHEKVAMIGYKKEEAARDATFAPLGERQKEVATRGDMLGRAAQTFDRLYALTGKNQNGSRAHVMSPTGGELPELRSSVEVSGKLALDQGDLVLPAYDFGPSPFRTGDHVSGVKLVRTTSVETGDPRTGYSLTLETMPDATNSVAPRLTHTVRVGEGPDGELQWSVRDKVSPYGDTPHFSDREATEAEIEASMALITSVTEQVEAQ